MSATICATGSTTAVTREVDYALVSTELGQAVKGAAATWLTAFSPRALIKLAIGRDETDLTKCMPRSWCLSMF